MKLILIVSLFFCASCVHPVKDDRDLLVKYPRAIKNKCGDWAIMTQPGQPGADAHFWGINLRESVFTTFKLPPDTTQNAVVPNEFIFSDSATAWSEFRKAVVIKDSIFQCQHTYQ